MSILKKISPLVKGDSCTVSLSQNQHSALIMILFPEDCVRQYKLKPFEPMINLLTLWSSQEYRSAVSLPISFATLPTHAALSRFQKEVKNKCQEMNKLIEQMQRATGKTPCDLQKQKLLISTPHKEDPTSGKQLQGEKEAKRN